jgi:phage tail sheath protein FI
LFALHFNLVRPEPRDFRVMSAHTLSDEGELLQLSVRRLMILLRKVAAERGMDFVFESNHERFREGVRVMLENVLRFMFERGAFSGATAEQAFRVVTDASVNPPQSIEQGRFIAQIQVAPSQPMEFITVLLTRTGEGLLVATEV